MNFHVTFPRTIPERRPGQFQPAAPKFNVRWTKPVTSVISDYIAIQHPATDRYAERDFIERARNDFDHAFGPDCYEELRHHGPDGLYDTVVVAYWTDLTRYAVWKKTSAFNAWWRSLDREKESVGYWRETLIVPYERFETIFAEQYYRVGVARTNDSEMAETYTAGYFGAMRDRLPISAIDALESPYGDDSPEPDFSVGSPHRIRIDVPANVVSIRSGQYWQKAESEQLEDYLDNLQPKLETGMSYLVDHPEDSGCLSLRPLVNLDAQGNELRETCKHGYFLSLELLERWSESHKSHLDIFKHALAMRRKYGAARSVVTWHEVFVLSAMPSFEYINCDPSTGLLRFANDWGTGAVRI